MCTSNKTWDLTNTNYMSFFSGISLKRKKEKSVSGVILEKLCSYGGTMTRLILFCMR